MKIRRWTTGLIITAMAIVGMSFSSFAGVKDAGILSSNGENYVFNSVRGSDISKNFVQAEKVLNSACPAVGMTTLDKIYNTSSGTVVITSEGAEKLDSIQRQVDSWLAQNIQSIVPQGTPASEVTRVSANWVSDRMTYDRSAVGNNALGREYQSALRCFTDGKGVCATYAYAFNSIVSAVPLSGGIVDYTATNPEHLATRFTYNNEHAWSAVNENGIWCFYDVCYYDVARDSSYLNMSTDKMAAGGYNNISVLF